jgi:dihydroneopterin aldolase
MNKSNSNFSISEPTEKEIELTIKKVKDQYNIVLSNEDAISYAKLYEELKQWFLIEKNANSPESIVGEMAEEIKDTLQETKSQEISSEQSYKIAEDSLSIVIPREKEQIGRELKAIIAKYR